VRFTQQELVAPLAVGLLHALALIYEVAESVAEIVLRYEFERVVTHVNGRVTLGRSRVGTGFTYHLGNAVNLPKVFSFFQSGFE
jgi:hypothetical protein